MPLSELTALSAYPPAARVTDFYRQSRQLAGFLLGAGTKPQFVKFFRLMAGGEPLESALRSAYGTRWSSLAALERDFEKHRGVTRQEGEGGAEE